MRPPFPYFGGKMTLAAEIAAVLPKHAHYVEPFAGSLAVLLAKPSSQAETANDLDGDLVHFWKMLRDRPDDLIRVCSLTPHSRAEHLSARQRDDSDDLERARRVWVMLAQSRTGTLRTTGWRFNLDTSRSARADLDAFVGRMAAAADRLARVSLECRPAVEVIRTYGASPDVLLYVDPPYLGGTRSTGCYRHEMETEPEHRTLADALHGCTATVVLSGYHSPLYDELYAGWHVHEMRTWTGQGGEKGSRVEVLWSNRQLATQSDLFGEAS